MFRFPVIKSIHWDVVPIIMWLVAVAIPYYSREPAPADLLTGLAVGIFIILVIFRKVAIRFDVSDWLLVGLIALVSIQEVLNQGANMRFTAISLYLFVSYFLIKHYFGTEWVVRWFFRAYLLASVVTVVAMVVQLVGTYSFGMVGLGLYFDRPDGLFKDANVAGPSLLLAVVYCQYFYLKTKNWLYWLGFVFFTSGVLLSFSRGAYLGLIGSVGLLGLLSYFYFVRYQKMHLKEYLLPVIVLLLSMPVLWFGLHLYQPFNTLSTSRFGTLIHAYDTSGRMVSWTAGLDSFIKQPFGTGSGSYEADSEKYQQQLVNGSTQPTTSAATKNQPTSSAKVVVSGDHVVDAEGNEIIVTPSAHNTFIRVLKENGILGFGLLVLFWLILVVQAIKNIWRHRYSAEWYMPYYSILLIGTLALLPMGTFIDTLHWRGMWYILSALAGLSVVLRTSKGDQP